MAIDMRDEMKRHGYELWQDVYAGNDFSVFAWIIKKYEITEDSDEHFTLLLESDEYDYALVTYVPKADFGIYEIAKFESAIDVFDFLKKMKRYL